MHIDMWSLLVAGTAMNMVFLGLSAFTWSRARGTVHGPQFWFAGFACFMVGIGLVALRGMIPDWLSIVVANTVILAGVMIKTLGILRFLKIRNALLERLLGAIVAVVALLLVFFYYVDESLSARMIATSIANVLIGAVASYVLLFLSPKAIRIHASLAVVFYGSFTGLYLFRSIYALLWSRGNRWFDSGDPVEPWLLVIVLVILGGIAVGELILLHGAQEQTLRVVSEKLAHRNERLRDEIHRRIQAEKELLAINRELGSTQKEIMITLSEVVEFRSKETALHVARVGEYARILSLAAGRSTEEATLIADAAPMHDIGKIAIPDEILNKPSGLSQDEIGLIRGHTTVGYQLLHKSDRALIKMAATIALEHHEYWDGGGYPEGKRGQDISFAGRVVCLCDVYDALAAARPYKAPWELTRILDYIRTQRGSMFDPELVDAFFTRLHDFIAISETLKDA
ncbi:MAG TPA: HD domain-containing phosphohydrolase [bacterium]|nr:HD domain-containing phosphohydrolase [bacterium]